MKWILLGVAFVLAGCGQPPTFNVDDVKLQILDFEQIEALIASHKGKAVVIDCWSMT